jgi:hypothetical protein
MRGAWGDEFFNDDDDFDDFEMGMQMGGCERVFVL